MKFVDEYRDHHGVQRLLDAIHAETVHRWSLMEVCGGQTHSLMRFGLDQLLPKTLTLLHGPGCPVCVTPLALLDQAVAIASRSDTVLCTFGDMLRVPGSRSDLAGAKSRGGDVRVVHSPLEALKLAEQHPNHEVVFFAVGFETTAPVTALAVQEAHRRGLNNFSLLVALVRVPPALEAILRAPGCGVQGFLAAGHVCAITGISEYQTLASSWRVPFVVTGFEPVDLLQGILMLVRQLESGRHDVEISYRRAVREGGNSTAWELLQKVFCVEDRAWRGMGVLSHSGLALREPYAGMDAARRFGIQNVGGDESPLCQSGSVLRGLLKPCECPAFGTRCVPESPLGATMVSHEGACAAHYRYRLSTPG